MRYLRVFSRGLLITALGASGLGAMSAVSAGPVPENVGGGLRQLIEGRVNAAANPASVSAAAMLEPRLLRDEQSRVLVNIWLDGGRPLTAVHQSLEAMG